MNKYCNACEDNQSVPKQKDLPLPYQPVIRNNSANQRFFDNIIS